LLLTFVLVVVAQWQPWFSLASTRTDSGFDFASSGKRAVGAITALNGLADAYYLDWTLIAIAASAAVLGQRRWRRVAAGITAGAIAGQTIVVLAVWHDNGLGVFRTVLGESGGLQGHREMGIYLSLAALIVAAASMVVAVRGRVLPSFADDEAGPGAVASVAPPAAPDFADEDFDLQRPRLGAPVVESSQALDDAAFEEPTSGSLPETRRETPDHSMFMRPRSADARR
jgi:hypothetical protein